MHSCPSRRIPCIGIARPASHRLVRRGTHAIGEFSPPNSRMDGSVVDGNDGVITMGNSRVIPTVPSRVRSPGAPGWQV
ncbi:hypothetical protein Sar04_22750 [Salinispora arenicola]|uniref:Uncharacterized protein n=1 Tax=Salinispora arenicola TaxID=168697 RepID=A0ABQ4JUN7_SALAC|nr:hypothetical protein Sar04_22750 [Salinispora arenicola]